MSKKTVLMVDDDEIFVEATRAILETRYEVRVASCGSEGLAEVAKEKPDLIILDVMMDHISEGFDVAKKLRTNDETKAIPIVMLTGVDQVYNVRMEVGEGWVPCDRYLEKPVAPDELLKVVGELIG
jgi:CheY-like chemotaxis protein